MFELNEYELAVALGVILFVLCFVVIIIESLWFNLYGFINDSKPLDHSKIISKISYMMGYTDRNSKMYRFTTPDGGLSDGTWPFIKYTLMVSLSPIFILIAFKFYTVTLFFVSSVALLFLARFVFRAKKVMSKHIDNKDIHKD